MRAPFSDASETGAKLSGLSRPNRTVTSAPPVVLTSTSAPNSAFASAIACSRGTTFLYSVLRCVLTFSTTLSRRRVTPDAVSSTA